MKGFDKRRGFDEPTRYQIKVQGELSENWLDWFSGLEIECDRECEDASITTLTGVIDQAALRGVLTRIWDLNLVVISVIPIRDDPR